MTESKPQRWRHLKRGSTYTEIARGDLQSTHPLLEGKTLVAYRSEHDGRVWFRPQAEFEDGRFERLPDQPAPLTESKPQWRPIDDWAKQQRCVIVPGGLARWDTRADAWITLMEGDRRPIQWDVSEYIPFPSHPRAPYEQPPPDSSPIPPERVPEAPAQIMKRAAEIAGKQEAYYIDMSEDGRRRDDWSEYWDQKQKASGAAAARRAILTEADLAAKGGAR